MASRRTIALIIMFGFGAVVALPARADSAGEACTALVNVRSALYSMINAKGKSERDALDAKVQASSKKLDSVLAAMSGNTVSMLADSEVLDSAIRGRIVSIIASLFCSFGITDFLAKPAPMMGYSHELKTRISRA